MLYIHECKDVPTPWHKWTQGESLPQITATSVTFEADGKELETILQALRQAKKDFTK